MTTRIPRTALFAAILALGLAGGVHAQSAGTSSGGSAGTSSATGATTSSGGSAGATSSPSSAKGSGSAATSGTMDKGAGTGAAKSSDAKLSGGERRFVETAARHGMAEVQLGKMAQDKAQDAQVKDFGRRMVEDHGKANDQLKSLASAKGVTLPTEPDAAHKRLADRLAKLSGAEFDHAYMKEMVDDHQKDVKEFRDMARSAKDAEVKAFASANLPVLEEHLKMAQALQKGGASASASNKGGGTSASATGSGASASATSKSGSGSTTSTAKGDKKGGC